jgi:predicted dehydrogenase
MKRREFLAASGGLALSALSYRRILGANDRLGVALVGSGRRGREVMKAMLATGRAELRAVADVYDVQRQRAAEMLGVKAPVTTAFEEALARPDVDAVLIGTPDHLHETQTLAALAAGKHLLLEKPTTHLLEEGPRLVAAVRASGKVCQTGTQQRSGAHYKQAKAEYFDTGKLGKVIFVRAIWSDFPWQRRKIVPQPRPAGLDWERFLGPARKVPYDWIRYDSWRYFPDYGGGLLADILTHWADVAQWFLNETRPSSAVASGGIYQLPDGRENPDTVSAILQYPGGWNLHFESSVLTVATPTPSVSFQGTEGSLDIFRAGYVYRPNTGQPVEQRVSENLELAHVTDFLDAVKDGRTPSADIEAGVAACNPIHLAKAAYWRKKRMRFDPTGTRIEEDA